MRLYSVNFSNVSVVAAQDLINLTATASMALKIHYVELGQKTIAAWEAKEVTFRRNSAVVTAGSGGAAFTPRPMNPSDVAATFTARINDTTAQTSPTLVEPLLARDWEFLNGFFWMPAPEQRPIIKPGQGFSINLGTAPSGAMISSGSVWVEELF